MLRKFFNKSYKFFLFFIFVIFGGIAFYKNFNSIPDNEVLKIAIKVSNPPFILKSKRYGYTGFDVDLIKALCKELNINYEIVLLDSDAMIPSIKSGLYDIGVSGISYNGDMEGKIDSSYPYLIGGNVIFRKKAYGENKSLKYKKIAVKKDSSANKIAKKKFKDSQIFEFEKLSDMYEAFNKNEVDIIIGNNLLLKHAVIKHKIFNGYLDKNFLNKEDYVLIFPKDSKYYKIINDKLKKLIISEKFKLLYSKWFGLS